MLGGVNVAGIAIVDIMQTEAYKEVMVLLLFVDSCYGEIYVVSDRR